MRKLEVELLSHYSPEKAFELAKQFQQFDKSYFMLVSNYLAAQLDKAHEVELDDKSLPRPDDLTPAESYLVVTPYLATRRYKDGLIFLYHQLRSHFSDERAHGQYMSYVLEYGKKSEVTAPMWLTPKVQSVSRISSPARNVGS